MEARNIYSADFQFDEKVINDYLVKLLGISTTNFATRIHKTAHNSCYILTSKNEPFLALSFAPLHDFNAAEARLKDAVQKTDTVGLGILTDGTDTNIRVLKRRFGRDGFDYVRNFDPVHLNNEEAIGRTFRNTTNGLNSCTLLPLTEKVEGVFFEAHSYMRDIDGFHADEALDELCKLIYLKLFDEESTRAGETYQIQRSLYSCVEEYAATIRAVYREANQYDLRVFSSKIPGYNRSRGVFNEPLKLSSPALVKAMETMQGYHIGLSTIDVKGRAFQKVLGPAVRSGMGQYFTPDPIVRLISRIIQPTVHDLIIDPFCGSGHFLTSCLQIVRSEHKCEDKVFHEFAFGKLHGIEKSDRMVRVAMTDMRLHGDGHSNIRCTDSLLSFSNYPDLQPESFDIILTNPPFGSLLGVEAVQQLGQYNLTEGRGNVPLENIGLERCIQLLRPGGRLGIVLPDGVLANRNSAYVRAWLDKKVKVRAIISLPVETFVPFGASIKTSILVVRKWRPGETRNNTYPVFLARIDNVGYDPTGRTKEAPDLETVGDDFVNFLAREGW